jgi:uncharacterized membrane protein YedE/YeeE
MTLPRFTATLAAGVLFGFGLALSSMIHPEVVLGFLLFQDFGLMLVMAGAVAVASLAFNLAPRLMGKSLLGDAFRKHSSNYNLQTALGAVIFGAGWGVCGVCPGPAIANLGTGNWDLLWALCSMVLGGLVHGLQARK